MAVHLSEGNLNEAIATYDPTAALLRRNSGSGPRSELSALIATVGLPIRRGSRAPTLASARRGRGRRDPGIGRQPHGRRDPAESLPIQAGPTFFACHRPAATRMPCRRARSSVALCCKGDHGMGDPRGQVRRARPIGQSRMDTPAAVGRIFRTSHPYTTREQITKVTAATLVGNPTGTAEHSRGPGLGAKSTHQAGRSAGLPND